jgi:hypothetical protein
MASSVDMASNTPFLMPGALSANSPGRSGR